MNNLEVAEVCKSYSGRMVVDHISFQAKAGQILGLWGRTERERRPPFA